VSNPTSFYSRAITFIKTYVHIVPSVFVCRGHSQYTRKWYVVRVGTNITPPNGVPLTNEYNNVQERIWRVYAQKWQEQQERATLRRDGRPHAIKKARRKKFTIDTVARPSRGLSEHPKRAVQLYTVQMDTVQMDTVQMDTGQMDTKFSTQNIRHC